VGVLQVPEVLLEDVDSRRRPWAKHKQAKDSLKLELEDGGAVTVRFSPFVVDVAVGGKPTLSLNSKGLFAFEHSRQKQVRARTRARPPRTFNNRIFGPYLAAVDWISTPAIRRLHT
jgi:hypothetical protein